jgi:hypothetical protein
VLPLLIKPDAKTFANIGFGSGLTTETLLSHSGPRVIDTVEIEPAMVSGARAFAPRVLRPYQDRRSNIHIEDAKSFFARHGKRYDVIVSEPSNPWVNGVASLFTTEFYSDIKRYLAPGGVLVQWLQLYEFNDRLLGSILAALGENFEDYEVYETNGLDLIVVAVAEGRVPPLGPLPVKEKVFMQQLAHLSITRHEEIAALSLGTKRDISRLLTPLNAPVNSDFHPFVQLEAPRARFRGSVALALPNIRGVPLPVFEMLSGKKMAYLHEPLPAHVPSIGLRIQSAALAIARGLLDRKANPLDTAEPRAVSPLLALKRPGALCGATVSSATLDELHRAAELTVTHLAPDLRRMLWIERRWLDCPPARIAPQARQRLDLYAAIAARDARAMHALADALLKLGSSEGGDEWGRYLLVTAMLGARASGEHAEVQRLWEAYRKQLYKGAIPSHVVYLVNK